MKKILSLLLVLFMGVSLTGFRVYASDEGVVPQESDYSVAGGTINGLTQSFVDSLNEQQKQNIKLVIPDSINGIAITSIADNALKQSKYTGCRFVELDLSQLTQLKSIGQWCFYNNTSMEGKIILPDTLTTIADHAFDGCSRLNGDLIIPNSVTTLGTYAFSGCKELKGRLQLSQNLTTISNYAFNNAGFTGTLEIPASVQTIKDSAFRQSSGYNGFTGKLVIPDTVTLIGSAAFSYQNGITGVKLSAQMTTVPTSMFRYCKGLSGVLEIPNTIQNIGENAFAETDLRTVYLPAMTDQGNSHFVIGSAFNSCTKLSAIICKENDYNVIRPMLSDKSVVQKKLSYEKQVQLQDDQNNHYEPLLKLYNLAYGYNKQSDKSWILDSNFKFPNVVGDTDNIFGWAVTADSKKVLSGTSLVGNESILYAVETLGNATIDFSADVDKIYDGETARLSVTVNHPKYVHIDDAKEGDVVVYYTWKWATITTSQAIQSGFDKATLDISEVYNPPYAIACTVTVQVCHVENNKAVPFQTVNHDFSVYIKQADPVVHPQYSKTVQLKDGMPNIKLSTGDTKGTITWDQQQVLQEGTHSYQWTFTPEENTVGSSNYKTITGQAEITATILKTFQVDMTNNGHGQVKPSQSFSITEGQNVTLTFLPDEGYRVASLKMNGQECISQLSNNSLTMKNVQSDYHIDILFEKITVEHIEDIISDIVNNTTDKELKQQDIDSLLNTKLNYEKLGDKKESLSQETKDNFNKLLSRLPQVQINTDGKISNSHVLLDNMTEEDTKALLDDPQAILRIDYQIKSISTQNINHQITTQIKDAHVAECYDITLIKTLSSQGQVHKTTLTQLDSAVQLIFDIPQSLPKLAENYRREYYVVRVHDFADQQEIKVLNNESTDATKIKISTDRFSTYMLAYKDVLIKNNDLKSDKTHPTQQPSQVSPQTNDDSQMTTWFALGMIACLVGGFIVLKKHRKH